MTSPIDKKLGRAFGKLSRSSGQFVFIEGKQIPAVITSPETDASFMMGMTLEETKIQARVRRCDLSKIPKVSDNAVIDGVTWRIVSINKYGASVLFQLADENN